jgi:hypothetical protein
MNYENIRTKEKQFKALTSLTVAEFDELLRLFAPLWDSWIRHFTISGKPRQRRYSPKSDKIPLTTEEKLFFILYYYKNNPLQEAQAAAFNMEQDMTNKLIHILLPLLEKSLSKFKPETNPQRLDTVLEKDTYYAADCTERRIQRDKHDQEHYYSGKKKAHCVKNFLLVNALGIVVFLSGMVEGKRHDKTLAQDLNLKIQQNITLGLDSAFRKLDFGKNVKIEIPHRKPRKKELCDEKKEQNRQMSSRRVIVENALAGCKRMRIVKDVIRLHGDYVKELTFSTAVRLHNFRTLSRNQLCS